MMFLWTYKTSSQNSKMEPCIRRMNRVVFVVASSPILLSAIIRTHLKQYESEKPTTAARLRESLYLDNVIMSLPDVDLFISYLSTSKVHIVCCWNGAMEIDDQLLWPKNEMDKRPDWKPSRFRDKQHCTESVGIDMEVWPWWLCIWLAASAGCSRKEREF